MELVREMAYKREGEGKGKQKKGYNERAKVHAFNVGDFVLVFRPTLKDKLQNQCQELFLIMKLIYTSNLPG